MNKLYMGRSRSKAKAKAKKNSHRNKKRSMRKFYKQHGGMQLAQDTTKLALKLLLMKLLLAAAVRGGSSEVANEILKLTQNYVSEVSTLLQTLAGSGGSVASSIGSFVTRILLSLLSESGSLMAGAMSASASALFASVGAALRSSLELMGSVGAIAEANPVGSLGLLMTSVGKAEASGVTMESVTQNIKNFNEQVTEALNRSSQSASSAAAAAASRASASGKQAMSGALIQSAYHVDQLERLAGRLIGEAGGAAASGVADFKSKIVQLDRLIETLAASVAPIDNFVLNPLASLMEYLGRRGVRGFVRTCQSVAGAAGAGACAITGFMGAAVNALQARLEQGPVAEPDDVDESQGSLGSAAFDSPSSSSPPDANIVLEIPPEVARSAGTSTVIELPSGDMGEDIVRQSINQSRQALEDGKVAEGEMPLMLLANLATAAASPAPSPAPLPAFASSRPASAAAAASQYFGFSADAAPDGDPMTLSGRPSLKRSLNDGAPPAPPSSPVDSEGEDDDGNDDENDEPPTKKRGGRHRTKKHRKRKTHKHKKRKHYKSHRRHKKSKKH